jgi:Family of unknown function (DUF6152)
MRFRCAFFAILLGLALAGTPTYAHHSVGAEFDLSKRIVLEGRVTKIEWMNPHVYLYVDVNADGITATWACETAGLEPAVAQNRRSSHGDGLPREGRRVRGFGSRNSPRRWT